MRTIKFLVFAVALAAVSAPALAQGGLQPGAFPGIDRYARLEARRIEHRQQLRHLGGNRFGKHGLKSGKRFGAHAGVRAGTRAGFKAGGRAGFKAGGRAGFKGSPRAGLRAHATPEQKAFAEQRQAQRQAVQAQVQAGTLTREQARTQMHAWVVEHRPK